VPSTTRGVGFDQRLGRGLVAHLRSARHRHRRRWRDHGTVDGLTGTGRVEVDATWIRGALGLEGQAWATGSSP
jgi:hypothetical protein